MIDKVFLITGHKMSSFITDENSLKFSSARFYTVEAFQEAFKKTLSLATKVDIKYNSIKSITKEVENNDISIKYKTFIGLRGSCKFSFTDPADHETFFAFMVQEQYFTKCQERLSSFPAMKNNLIGLLATIGITAFTYFQAIRMENGTVEGAHSGKALIFNFILGLLGARGVLAVGALTSCYLVYKIWNNYSNPPNQVILTPPNT